MTPGQAEILRYLQGKEQATKKELYESNRHYSYYRNWEKYFGNVLTGMVKANKITRIKPGVYRLWRTGDKKHVVSIHAAHHWNTGMEIPNQQELF